MEHTRNEDIMRINGRAAHALVGVDARGSCADDVRLPPWLQSGCSGLTNGGFVIWQCRVVEGHSPSPCTVSSLQNGEKTIHGSVSNLQLQKMKNKKKRVGYAPI
jgi:hypothetical protein